MLRRRRRNAVAGLNMTPSPLTSSSFRAASEGDPQVLQPLRPLRRPLRSLHASLLFLGAITGQALADGSVALKSVARLDRGRPVLLSDVALLEGPDALALADVSLLADPAHGLQPGQRWVELSIEQVRASLHAADPRAASRVTLRGRSCAVIARGQVEPAPEAPPRVDQPTAPAIEPGTLAAAIEDLLASTLGVSAADLRITFDDQDRTRLAAGTAGRSLDLRIAGWSAHTPIDITIFNGDEIEYEGVVRVGVLVRRAVLVSTAPISRGQRVADTHFTIEDRWLSPTAAPAVPAEAWEQELRCALRGGEVLETRHVTPPVVIRRGDRVVVSVVCGSVLIEEEARALRDARRGDIADLESIDGQRRTIRARIQGPGRAVIAASTVESES